jgi:CP family cyanate transporter-like MFS transporter
MEHTATPAARDKARDSETSAGATADVTAGAGTTEVGTTATGTAEDGTAEDGTTHHIRVSPRGRMFRLIFLAVGFGGQAFSYYGLTAWLPQILAALSDIPTAVSSAGSSLFQVFAIVGALGVPLLTRRLPYWYIVAGVCVLWATVPLGLLFGSDLWALWLSFGGIAQGGTFTLVFIVVVELATTDAEAGRGSALVQGLGYAIGATGPSVFGALHDLSGGWTVPLVAVLVAVGLLATGGTIASRGMGVQRGRLARGSR